MNYHKCWAWPYWLLQRFRRLYASLPTIQTKNQK